MSRMEQLELIVSKIELTDWFVSEIQNYSYFHRCKVSLWKIPTDSQFLPVMVLEQPSDSSLCTRHF